MRRTFPPGGSRAQLAKFYTMLAAVAFAALDTSGLEPDHWVVVRRGPSGFGVVATPDNLITGLRGPAAEDGLLHLGDLVLEVDGDRILEGETLVSHCRAHQRDTHTLGVLRAMPEDEAEAEVPSLAAMVKSMLGNEKIRGAVSKMAVSMVKGLPADGSSPLLAGAPDRPLLAGGPQQQAQQGTDAGEGALAAPGLSFDEAQLAATRLVSKCRPPCA